MKKRTVAPCYMLIDVAGTSAWYRSPIVDGRVTPNPDYLGRAVAGWVYVDIEVKRSPHFEADTPVALLTSQNWSNTNLSGSHTVNPDPTTLDHWMHDMPAPLSIEVHNNRVGTTFGDVIVGTGKFCQVIEGEAMTAGSGVTKTTPARAGASGATDGRFVWTGDIEKLLAYSNVGTGATQTWQGEPALPLIRTNEVDTTIRLKIVLSDQSNNKYAETEWVTASQKLLTFPALRIPPGRLMYEHQLVDGLRISVYGIKTGGGSVDVDYLELFPATNVRIIKPLNPATSEYTCQRSVGHDSGTDEDYVRGHGGTIYYYASVIGYGSGGLNVGTGTTYIAVKVLDTAGDAPIATNGWQLTVTFRPRVRSLGKPHSITSVYVH